MTSLPSSSIKTSALNSLPNSRTVISETLVSQSLSKADYNPTHEAMLARTLERIANKKAGLRTADELWIVEHNDVYTLGQAGKEEHILQRTDTPIIKTDRGGQVTWHGSGQLVVYWLFDLQSLNWSVRHLVSHAEQAIEDVVNNCLDIYNLNSTPISAHARRDAPGVYLYSGLSNDAKTDASTTLDSDLSTDAIMLGKMASLGFKIKQGFSYHGIALNINCDLSAFNAINPCGYAGMQMLRLADFVAMNDDSKHSLSYNQVTQMLIDNIAQRHASAIELRDIAPK